MGAASGVTGGFGDALTAALDVMAFAHDIDLTTATEGIPTTDPAAKAAKSQQNHQTKVASNASAFPQPPIPKASSTCLQTTPSENHDLAQSKISGLTELMEPRPDTGVRASNVTSIVGIKNGNPISGRTQQANSSYGTSGQLQPNQVLPSGEATIANGPSRKENLDPLLDLVIASESPTSQQATLLRMAAEAARISSEAETTSVTVTSAATNAVTANRITNDSKILDKLGGLGAVIPASMLPSQNLPVQKPPIVAKKYFAEFSDNDLCGNDSLLGTDARLRRIRSASVRLSASSKRRPCQANTEAEADAEEDRSSSSPSIDGDENTDYQPLTNGPEIERGANDENRVGERPSLLPAKDFTNDPTSTGRNGIAGRENGCNERVNKNHKRRAKTAKNRVSPKESNDSGSRRRESVEKKMRGVSGESDSSRRTKGDNDVDETTASPTSDPLEPWSTRGIKDMNAILAWRENGPDSP